jgi:hypothetical protein
MSIKNNTTSLQELLEAVNNLPNASSGGEQATPVISVNSTNGLITATAGAKTSTHQLAFQPAKTITPSTASQIAVSSGYYTGGNVMVAGDANLVAENIKSGVSVFGVSGTCSGSNEVVVDDVSKSVFEGAITEIEDSNIKYLRPYAFCGASQLTKVVFPNCTTMSKYEYHNPNMFIGVGGYTFAYCARLTTANFPKCSNIEYCAFYDCISLTTVGFPACTTINNSAFYSCASLTTVSFPVCTSIGARAFYSCYNLKSLYLMGSSLCALSNSNAFTSTPIGGYSTSAGTYGSIYVPASLLTSYQTATNWTYFSSRFVGV